MDFKQYKDNIIKKLPKSKSSFVFVIAIFGLLLILVSSFDFNTNKTDSDVITVMDKTVSNEQYVEKVEKKIEDIISDMLGGSKVTVMVTLESGSEFVYADEIKVNADIKKDQGSLKTEQSDSNQKTYIVVKDSEGNETPLVITEKMPVIRGVVIVCESGEKSTVCAAVKLAVKAALDVDEDKICVVGRY